MSMLISFLGSWAKCCKTKLGITAELLISWSVARSRIGEVVSNLFSVNQQYDVFLKILNVLELCWDLE